MSKYGCAVTKQGLALLAKIIATKSNLTLVRVMMGSGEPPESVYIGDLEDLVEPVAAGTVSEPIYKGATVEMTVEYRSDMNGGLKEGFLIREFGIFARDGEAEILLFYGNLSDYPQYIAPWDGLNLDVRRYPVSITVAEGTEVILEGLPGTVMTIDDVKDYCVSTLLPQLLTASQNQIANHNRAPDAHPDLRQQLEQAFQSISEVQASAGGVKESLSFAIAPEDWTEADGVFRYDLEAPETAAEDLPLVILKTGSLTAEAETFAGFIRLTCKVRPVQAVSGMCHLLGPGGGGSGGQPLLPATEQRLGGVKVGSGLTVTEDGTLSVDAASEEEVTELLTEALAASDNK